MADKKNSDEAQNIRKVLNLHELTAVAIQEGVVDECVYRRWFNTTYVSDYDATKNYISEARQTYKNTAAFSEFEKTAIRWRDDATWGLPPSWARRKWLAIRKVWTS